MDILYTVLEFTYYNILLANVFHMRAGHTSELDTPPTLVNLNAFISTKTPLN